MITGCYDLALYCDEKNKAHEYKEFPHEYQAEFGSHARAKARRDGWRINRREGIAICPKCTGKRAGLATTP